MIALSKAMGTSAKAMHARTKEIGAAFFAKKVVGENYFARINFPVEITPAFPESVTA